VAGSRFHLQRVTADLKREIGWTVANRLRDPRVPHVVTITDLKLAPDTRNATVYVSLQGAKEGKEVAVRALNGAAPFIQREVSSKVSVRHFPKLYFKLDTSLEQGERINELLKEIQDDLD